MTDSTPQAGADGPIDIPGGLQIHPPLLGGVSFVPIVATTPPPIPSASAADLAALRQEVSDWMAGAQKQLTSLTAAFNSLQQTFVSVVEAYEKHRHGVLYNMQRLPQMNWDGSVAPEGSPPGLPYMLEWESESSRTTKPTV